MSVIVKGMKMPNNCVDCEFGLYRFGIICQLRDYENERNVPQKYIDDDIRPDWCPLIEIPEGARLIDKQIVKERMVPLDFSVQNWISEVDLDLVPIIFEED